MLIVARVFFRFAVFLHAGPPHEAFLRTAPIRPRGMSVFRRSFLVFLCPVSLACTPQSCERSSNAAARDRALEASATSADRSPESAPTPADERRVLAFLGDSLTAGYGLKEEESFPSRIRARVDADPVLKTRWRIVNAGVSGDTSRGGLERMDWLFRSKPAFVFVCLGANDGLRGQGVADTERNLASILARIKEHGAKAALAGMRMPDNYGPDYTGRFAALFPRVAEAARVPYLPFLMEGVALDPRLTLPDGVHPNAEGAEKVAARVWAFLRPLLPS